MSRFALALHGGAGASRKLNYDRERAHMRDVVESARRALAQGRSALDVAVAAVTELEASGLYIAGRGGSPNSAGVYELDACVMDGQTRQAGSIACVRDLVSPIQLARLVMERTPHVMLCGAGAEAFAREMGAAFVEDANAYFTQAGQGESNYAPGQGPGTVGCVVLDAEGRLASATSTAGVFGKTPGRVGDSPLVGAGGWADENVAVSCTGQGELFIRVAAAARIAFQVEAGVACAAAAQRVIDEIGALGGEGGLIAIDRDGRIAMPYNAEGLKRAILNVDGSVLVRIFDD